MSVRTVHLATGNAHKLAEFEALLKDSGLRVVSAAACGGMPEVAETGRSFEANARLKAEALRRAAPAGAGVLADDSGLEVDFLHGGPGVFSARYAGPDADDRANVEKLLWALRGVPEARRTARFRCALCWIDGAGEARIFEGACEGRILEAARGAEGFGYDPVFAPEGESRSFAELGEAVKSRLSHRAAAVRRLREAVAGAG